MRAWTEIGCGFGRVFGLGVAVGLGRADGVARADGAAAVADAAPVPEVAAEGAVRGSLGSVVQPPTSRPRVNRPKPVRRITSRFLPDRANLWMVHRSRFDRPETWISAQPASQKGQRSRPATTTAMTDGRSARVTPWEGVRTSNTGPSTGLLIRIQTPAAATRPTATHRLRRMAVWLENRLVTDQG